MNFINKLFLKIALAPVPIYRRMEVQPDILKAILTTKLIMDDRRPNTFHQTQHRKKEKPITMATAGTMLLSALMGLMYLFAFAFGDKVATQLTMYFSFFFFMLAATLISDFTTVLIDVRDNLIILPKPVNDRTFVTARLLHIFIHIGKLIVPMSLPGLIYIAANYGFTGSTCFVLMVVMVTLFTIFFINALYIAILQITTPQRFQSIISYVQIFFAIAIYASYQIVPRLMGNLGEVQIDFSQKAYSVFISSYWFASGWDVLYSLHIPSATALIAAILSIVVPVMSLWIVIKYLAPSFNKKLALINSTSTEASEVSKKNHSATSPYVQWLSRLCTANGTERMGFLFSWKMTARSRDFKIKVYPAIGYLLVYGVVIAMGNKSFQLQDIQQQTAAGKTVVLIGLYFSSILFTTAVQQIGFSEKYKASWIFYTTPVDRPGAVISGSIKAAIFKFYIPVVVLVLISGVALIGPSVLPNIVLGLGNVWLIVLLMAYVSYRQLPFSQSQNNNTKSGNFLKVMAIMLLTGLIGFIHYVLYPFTIVIGVLAILSAIAVWLVSGSIKNTSWKQVAANEVD